MPVIGGIIRQVPGTISLGQGVVHYGPPQAALDAVRDALDRRRRRTNTRTAPACRRWSSGSRRSCAPRTASTSRAAAASWSPPAPTWRSCTRCWRSPRRATRSSCNVPFYFNHEMAIQMAGCTAVRVATDDRYQLRLDALRAAITDRTRAIVTVSPNNPSGAVFSEASLRDDQRALPRPRDLSHRRRGLRVLHLRHRRGTCRRARFPAPTAHTISMYSLSKAYGFAGWRIGYMVYPEHLAAAMVKSQDTILVCPPVASQVGGDRGARGRPRLLRAARPRARRRSATSSSRELSALAPLASVPAADGAFYCLLKVDTDAGSDGARRAADPRAQGRGDSRARRSA